MPVRPVANGHRGIVTAQGISGFPYHLQAENILGYEASVIDERLYVELRFFHIHGPPTTHRLLITGTLEQMDEAYAAAMQSPLDPPCL